MHLTAFKRSSSGHSGNMRTGRRILFSQFGAELAAYIHGCDKGDFLRFLFPYSNTNKTSATSVQELPLGHLRASDTFPCHHRSSTYHPFAPIAPGSQHVHRCTAVRSEHALIASSRHFKQEAFGTHRHFTAIHRLLVQAAIVLLHTTLYATLWEALLILRQRMKARMCTL